MYHLPSYSWLSLKELSFLFFSFLLITLFICQLLLSAFFSCIYWSVFQSVFLSNNTTKHYQKRFLKFLRDKSRLFLRLMFPFKQFLLHNIILETVFQLFTMLRNLFVFSAGSSFSRSVQALCSWHSGNLDQGFSPYVLVSWVTDFDLRNYLS